MFKMFNMTLGVRFFKSITVASCALAIPAGLQAQINTNGCALEDFGINASYLSMKTLTAKV